MALAQRSKIKRSKLKESLMLGMIEKWQAFIFFRS